MEGHYEESVGKLGGQKERKHSLCWIYFLYPLVTLLRTAQFLFALLKYFICTGYFPYFDNIFSFLAVFFRNEIIGWSTYFISYACLSTVRILSLLVEWWMPFISHCWIGFDPGKCYKYTWMSTYQKDPYEIPILAWTDVYYAHQNKVLYQFDVRYMVLSGYCLYPWFNYLSTGTPDRWFSAYMTALDLGHKKLHTPTQWLLLYFKTWPPDGFILASILFIAMILAHLMVLFKVILTIFGLKLTNLCNSIAQVMNPSFYYKIPDRFTRVIEFLRGSFSSKKNCFAVLSTFVYNASTACDTTSFTFDSDSVDIVLDNSANTHIWSRLEDFVEGTVVYLSDDTEYGVVTIGDTECRPVAHGTVLVSLKDDDNNECELQLEDTLYFPTSPVNVLGVTKLGEQLNDENGTWIKTSWRRSTFS